MNASIVVKVGGSLLDWPGLPAALTAFLAPSRSERLVLVAGGGRAADSVREFDQIHRIGQERAHHLAVRSLDLTAYFLESLLPGSVVVERVADLESAWISGRIPILTPRPFLEDDDRRSTAPLPHHWDVTSDSIAARLAVVLEASELILLKSAALPPECDRVEAARLGLVDDHFPAASSQLGRVSFRNLRDAEDAGTYA